MDWIKQNARLLAFLTTLIFSIGAVAFTVGSAIQKSNNNKETIKRIKQDLDELPTPEQLEAINLKLEFLIEFMQEQRKIMDKQFEQIEKRIEKLEKKIDNQ